MSTLAPRWSDLVRPWLKEPARFRLLTWLLPPAVALLLIAAPLQAAAALAACLLTFVLSRSRMAVALSLIALMGNVKINYYTGFVTLFPEYAVLAVASVAWALGWATGQRRLEERNLMLLFAAFFVAGCLSFVNAIEIPRVFSRAIAIALCAVVLHFVVAGIRSRADLKRALRWLEGAVLVVALYGILQMVSLVTGWDVGLRWFAKYGNPDFWYGVGTPVVLQYAKTFRANSFFNDSNILAGYLAAAMCVVLALRIHHGDVRRSRRAAAETGVLLVTGFCLLLAISRSGVLALLLGGGVVLALMPQALRSRSLWTWAAFGLIGMAVAAAAVGTNPLLLFTRLASALNQEDYSNQLHAAAARYALSLIARFPITGVGLGNFGRYFGAEENAHLPGMMAHNATLGFFAETGLLGGGLFLALLFAIARRPWRALRDPGLKARDPELHAMTAGLSGALVALLVSNLFYDFSMRTFVWVFAGLAVSAARLWERRRDGTPAA